MYVKCVCGNGYWEDDKVEITICSNCKAWNAKDLPSKQWLKSKNYPRELECFWLGLLDAEAVRE
jgi:hypothetical protein